MNFTNHPASPFGGSRVKIHYCWFGGKPLPKDARKCIRSWQKFFPDSEIVLWNEDNFDINICPYVAEAYAMGKYAFVSDYARYWVLYHHGGLYFDTDVEVIADMSDLLNKGPFMGIEKSLATNGTDPNAEIGVNPGLGYFALPGMPFIKEILDYYDTLHFDMSQGTIVYHTTQLMKRYGLVNENRLQQVAGFTIYPDDVLCPMDSTTGLIHLTDNTVSIHHYSCSWIDHNTLGWRLHRLKNLLIRLFGEKIVRFVINGNLWRRRPPRPAAPQTPHVGGLPS